MPHWNRRQILRGAGAGVLTLALGPLATLAQERDRDKEKGRGRGTYPFKLPPLPYAYDALEPSIDKMTMQIHHDKHHQAYINNLNNALKEHEDLHQMSVVQLLRNLDKVPKNIQAVVRNNAGGHANHTMFWEIMGPEGSGKPEGDLARAIDETFGSFSKFQEQFSTAAKTLFGSGWAWLVGESGGKLSIVQKSNQDSPHLDGKYPILGLDVWEHAYYLKYRNERPRYVEAWWKVVNWKTAGERFARANRSRG